MGTSCQPWLGYPGENSLKMPLPAPRSMAKGEKHAAANWPCRWKRHPEGHPPADLRGSARWRGTRRSGSRLPPAPRPHPVCPLPAREGHPPGPRAAGLEHFALILLCRLLQRTSLQHCSSKMFLPCPAWGLLLFKQQQQPHKLLAVLPLQGGL